MAISQSLTLPSGKQAASSAESERLCSPEGLLRLVSQFNVNGQFTIPDPNADLQTFLATQRGYRVQSILSGLTPVPLSRGSIHTIMQSNPTYPALAYPMPTSLPCVNWLFLAAGNAAGSWPPPTYALGRYQLQHHPFLIVVRNTLARAGQEPR